MLAITDATLKCAAPEAMHNPRLVSAEFAFFDNFELQRSISNERFFSTAFSSLLFVTLFCWVLLCTRTERGRRNSCTVECECVCLV